MKKLLLIAVLVSGILLLSGMAQAEEPVFLPIVMYHHISEDSGSWNDYVISAAEFEGDLRWLREHGFHTVRWEELLAWSRGEGELPEKPCMITFDDGFESVLVYAEPLLEQYGFTGVCALIGSATEKASSETYRDVRWSSLTWDEARDMGERGTVELICHTWNLHGLGERRGCARKPGEGLTEYRASLTKDLGKFFSECSRHGVVVQPVVAYPYGAYSRETTEAVRDFGLLGALTCTERGNLLTAGEDTLYTLGRFNRPHGISREKFFGKWEKSR